MLLSVFKASALTLLARAEQIFGAQEAGWPTIEVELDPNGPVLDSTTHPGRLIAYLSSNSAGDINKGLYQLAHETIHMLAPVPGNAMMIEEAAAVWFSLYGHPFPSDTYLKDAEDNLRSSQYSMNYLVAWKLYGELESVCPAAIRFLRSHDPRLDNLDPAKIQALIPDVSTDLANRLCERRQMR